MCWTASCLLGLAALALGQALQVKNGFFHPRALIWLVFAFGFLLLAVSSARMRSWRDPAARFVLVMTLLGGVLYQTAQLLAVRPLMYSSLRHGRSDPVLLIVLIATAMLAIVVAVAPRRFRVIAFGVIVAVHLVAGGRVVRLVPSPGIDVVTVQEAAIDALAQGRSPYSITFKNIYGQDSGFYGEGMTRGSRVLFGLPYPPLTLAFSAPAEWLFGDYRYATVACLAAAALLIGSIAWTRHAMLAATVLLTTPRIFFLIEQGWTEPFAIFLLALTVAMLARAPSRGSTALGLTVAVKQYLAVALLLVPLLPRSAATPPRARILNALGVAAVVTLPFFMLDRHGFLQSVVLLQLREPFRADSLSVLAWLARNGLQVPAMATTLVAGVLALVLALRRLPSSASGFSAGMALVTFMLFAFGKKAFCNYYFFVLGAMVVAIAATRGVAEDVTPAKSG